MPSAVIKAFRKLRAEIVTVESWMNKLLSPNSTLGTRAAPPQTASHDARFGLRIDNGKIFTVDGVLWKRLIVQVNRNAEDPKLKKLCEQVGSHHILATVDVPLPAPGTGNDKKKELIDGVLDDMEEGLKDE